jgi:hypothetical protein
VKRELKSQWDCLLQNLGEWQGSFTQLAPDGTVLDDAATIVSLQGLHDNQTIRQTIRRLNPPDEKVLEYSSLGRGVLFFENGAFSQGSIQFGPFSEFGTELGLIAETRRLRLVQLFNRDSKLDRLTLIREQLAGSNTPERPPLQVKDLLGTWQGEAVTLYPDWRSPDTYSTELQIELVDDRLTQSLSFGETTLRSIARIADSTLHFDNGTLPIQILLLPDGASSNSPTQITPRTPFVLEVGWLLEPNLRQRLVRSYNDKGEWVSLTLITERKPLT